MSLKHIVFDWDGTLADTYPVISAAFSQVFQQLGRQPIPYEEIKRITSTLQNKDILEHLFGDKKDQAKLIYDTCIRQNHITGLKAMPSALEVLQFCKDKGFNIYLLSNKRRQFLLPETDKLGFTKFFKKIVAAGDFKEDKPSPVATHALFDNNLPDANSIMVVGDGLADWKVARTYDTACQKAVCVICNPELEIAGDRPDYQISNLNDLISILQKQ